MHSAHVGHETRLRPPDHGVDPTPEVSRETGKVRQGDMFGAGIAWVGSTKPQCEGKVHRLLATVNDRLSRFGESWDPSVILDRAVSMRRAGCGQPLALGTAIRRQSRKTYLTVLAYLYLARFQALPEGQDQDDNLSAALGLFGVLAVNAAARVPEQLRDFLIEARQRSAGNADLLMNEGFGCRRLPANRLAPHAGPVRRRV